MAFVRFVVAKVSAVGRADKIRNSAESQGSQWCHTELAIATEHRKWIYVVNLTAAIGPDPLLVDRGELLIVGPFEPDNFPTDRLVAALEAAAPDVASAVDAASLRSDGLVRTVGRMLDGGAGHRRSPRFRLGTLPARFWPSRRVLMIRSASLMRSPVVGSAYRSRRKGACRRWRGFLQGQGLP